jgi:hypothetical protein
MLGCEDDVAGPDGVQEPFSMFGIINPRLNTQSIMVSPIETRLVDYPDAIDAVVRSLDLETGQTRQWHDSVVVGDRGQNDHVYLSDFRPNFGSRHRIEVIRSDGAASEVEVEIPDRVTFDFEDTGTRRYIIRILGENFRVVQADIVYGVRFYSPSMTSKELCEESPLSYYSFPLTARVIVTGGDTQLELDMFLHADVVRSLYALENEVRYVDYYAGLALTRLRLEVTIGDESWRPPGGTFDGNVLSAPRTLSNVTNGFGFVGGGYNEERRLWPSTEAIKDGWFYDFLMRPPSDCLDFCSCGSQ